jgi:NAD(P)H-dependent FMN reductase
MTAPLKNAVDFLYSEWNYKAAGLVSYGGISGGLRAQQQAKQVLTAVRMMPVPESVSIPFVAQYLKDGKLDPPEAAAQSAQAMLDELRKWTTALLSLRVRQA